MWSLNDSLLSSIISRYFRLGTWVRSRLLRYISSTLLSLRFLLDSSSTYDFRSLNWVLLAFAHVEILDICMYIRIYVCMYYVLLFIIFIYCMLHYGK